MGKVAIQGTRGSYSEEAAIALFGDQVAIAECFSFDEAFEAIESGRAEYCVIPIKNKIVGEIVPAVRRLHDDRFRIIDRTRLPVEHVLLGPAGARRSTVRTVTSHAEAPKQCLRFLVANPLWLCMAASDTAGSVRKIAERGNRAHAAIGSRRAAEIYGAEILEENIADEPENWTVFAQVELWK